MVEGVGEREDVDGEYDENDDFGDEDLGAEGDQSVMIGEGDGEDADDDR